MQCQGEQWTEQYEAVWDRVANISRALESPTLPKHLRLSSKIQVRMNKAKACSHAPRS